LTLPTPNLEPTMDAFRIEPFKIETPIVSEHSWIPHFLYDDSMIEFLVAFFASTSKVKQSITDFLSIVDS